MKRSLTLRRETLTELASAELAAVAGGNESGPQPTPPIFAPRTLVIEECFAFSAYLNCGDYTASPRCA